MALFLSERDVRPLIDPSEAVAVVERSLLQLSEAPAFNLSRRRMWGRHRREVYVLGGITPGGETLAVRMSARGLANFTLLFSESKGGLAALIEHLPLGRARTGAATGIATKYLARQNAQTIGIIGTGSMAPMQLACICAVRKIKQISAYSRNPDHLVDFCQRMTKELGVIVKPTKSAENAIRDADIVVTLTNSTEPVLFADWLAPGVHVNAVGANEARRREIDDETVRRSEIVVIDDRAQGKIEARALIEAVDAGWLAWKDVTELAELVQPSGVRRKSDRQTTLFHSLGIGYLDAVYAEHIFHKAEAVGIGRRFG